MRCVTYARLCSHAKIVRKHAATFARAGSLHDGKAAGWDMCASPPARPFGARDARPPWHRKSHCISVCMCARDNKMNGLERFACVV
eukprot:5826684-Prymnesium_polylepis.1